MINLHKKIGHTVTEDEVWRVVSFRCNQTKEEILANRKCQKPEYVLTRMILMILLNRASNFTITETCAKFMKNHSAVYHSIKTVKDLCDTDMKVRELVSNILKDLQLADNFVHKIKIRAYELN